MLKEILHSILGIEMPDADPDDEENTNLDSPYPCFITFARKMDGGCDIQTNWLTNDKTCAVMYAELLYGINHGYLESYIFELLDEYGKNKNCPEFVAMIKEAYSQTNIDQPVVKPSRVLN
jgi:hypothetical protein